MSLAKFLRGTLSDKWILQWLLVLTLQAGQNHWARDLIFVFGDDYIEGIEAFLATYHGLTGDSKLNRWGTQALGAN